VSTYLDDKVVLVTGGTGSFGKAFTDHVLKTSAVKKLIILSRDELKQYEMQQTFSDDRLRYFLGDVRDKSRLYRAFDGVDVVVHAAALKQIQAGEYNPSEFVKTNITGTENVLSSAIDRGVSQVVVLSSDKASAPISAYGASKAMAEHLTTSYQSYSSTTKFAVTRYGNVAGSRGSVIPVWKSLVQVQKTLPITDIRMTRFFFEMSEAIKLVLWALENMHGGELIVPKIPSFFITDLCKALEAPYQVVGIRGVEKLAESMISVEEGPYFSDIGTAFIRYRSAIANTLPYGFCYQSDTNTQWLTIEDLKRILHTHG